MKTGESLLSIGKFIAEYSAHLMGAGVETDARGAIIVDEYLKTTNPNIRQSERSGRTGSH